MKLTEIQDLIKFVAKAGVTEVELESNDFKITIKTDPSAKKRRGRTPGKEEIEAIVQPVVQPVVQAQPVVQQAAPQPVAQPAPQPAAQPAAETPDAGGGDESNYITIKSPMIGTFYRKPSPDKDVFVNVGDEVKEGDVVCVIEAMKLFNEIESEMSGKIVKVLVEDNAPVEYDQPLFLVDPS